MTLPENGWTQNLSASFEVIEHSMNIVTHVPLVAAAHTPFQDEVSENEDWLIKYSLLEAGLVHLRLVSLFLIGSSKKGNGELALRSFGDLKLSDEKRDKIGRIHGDISSWSLHYGDRRRKDSSYPPFNYWDQIRQVELLIEAFEELIPQCDNDQIKYFFMRLTNEQNRRLQGTKNKIIEILGSQSMVDVHLNSGSNHE